MNPNMKNLFFDTNVIIGYIFRFDSLYPQASKLISQGGTWYYSYHVNREIKQVFNEKINDYNKLLVKISRILNRHNDFDFISKSDLQDKIANKGDIGKINKKNIFTAINQIWDYYDFGENVECGFLKLKLTNLIRNMNILIYNDLKNFKKNLNYIPAHQYKESSILKEINNKSLQDKFHGEDKDILFDVHEYCKKYPDSDIYFVSADKDFIDVICELLHLLSFNRYIDLNFVDKT